MNQDLNTVNAVNAVNTINAINATDVKESCCSTVCCNHTMDKLCYKFYKDRSDIETVLDGIDLPPIQKQHIQSRYINILENMKKRVRKYSLVFHIGHFIITVGSLFVPALLSIQNSNVSFSINGYSIPVYIITFVVSLLVTIFNGILTLFKIDKKYYFLTTTMERLRSEGWQFLGLTGRYSGNLNNTTPTHANQFLYFTHQIEKIKMKQVEEEFYKSNESNANDPKSNAKTNDLYPPSLTQPITSLASIVPEPVREAVQSIIKQNDDIIGRGSDSTGRGNDSTGRGNDSVEKLMNTVINSLDIKGETSNAVSSILSSLHVPPEIASTIASAAGSGAVMGISKLEEYAAAYTDKVSIDIPE
jgi:hypothetical protein